MVFQSPPDAVATYQILRFLGSMATSAMRPEVKVPGILRRASSWTDSGVSVCAGKMPRETTTRKTATDRVRFMTIGNQYIPVRSRELRLGARHCGRKVRSPPAYRPNGAHLCEKLPPRPPRRLLLASARS